MKRTKDCFYLIGSLRNPQIPAIANVLEAETGCEIFADWFAAGPLADDSWRDYEKARGRTYLQALNGYAAKHVFSFDKYHLQRSRGAILVLPAGRSSHLELGWMLGQGKLGFVLMDSPDRWDVMFQFSTGIYETTEDLVKGMRKYNGRKNTGSRRSRIVTSEVQVRAFQQRA